MRFIFKTDYEEDDIRLTAEFGLYLDLRTLW